MKIKSFFEPKTIAVVGASEHPEKVGFALMKNLSDFKGKVVPINQKHEILFGKKCYKSVLDYKGKIDLAVIAVPAIFAARVMAECGKKKIRNAVVITAGFSEIGNIKGEKELVKIAERYKISLLGPNCFGVSNPYNNLDTTFAKTNPGRGNIAFVSQSGALWSFISDLAAGKFGFSGFASLGNPVGLDFSDFIRYFSKDKKTNVIVIYVEKISNGGDFLKEAKKCRKPVYAVKAGSTKEGTKAAISHTGSLATDYEIYKGAFKQAGVVLCESLESAFEKASRKKLSVKDKKRKTKMRQKNKARLKGKIAIITNAGGAGALAADYCSQAGLDVCGVYDILGAASPDDYKKTISKLKNKAGNFMIIATPQLMTDMDRIDEAIDKAADKIGKSKKIIKLFLGGKSVRGFGDFNTLEEFRKSLI